ncbi:MAG: alpha-(1-_3)-arabinofuranosyltransferase family protein [Acidimicrobiales bacterium]
MDRAPTSAGERRALVASTALVAVVVLLQAPGRIVPETKLDVYVEPWRFLQRALGAWDPSAAFGRVQNQAIGYVFPMGAFTTALRAVGVPPWLVQRAWIVLVVSLALWGAHRVAAAVGVGSAAGRLVAAWAYAVAPATMSLAAFQSAGQLPYSVLPHVLAPLLVATPGASPRRVAARSTLWIVVMGGVNGASSFAVLAAVVVWFATRSPGPDRRRLAGWWALGATAATVWWLVPLLVSIRYGVRFTDFTEQSSVTTVTESGLEVLRGTGNWLSYLRVDAGPWLPGSRAMATSRVAIVGTVAVAAAGLVAMCRRDAPGRRWLVPTFLIGTIAMGVGYAGAWGGAGSGLAQQLLDGPFVAFRNVHKFAALVRLPIAIGLGHLVALASVGVESSTIRRPRVDDSATGLGGRTRGVRIGGTAAACLASLAIVLAILPATNRLTAPGSFASLPRAWDEAAAWLAQHDDHGRALLLPGSSFAEYRWGRPLDEPLSPAGRTPWAVRDLIPLGGNGSTRLLDGIDRALATDALPPGFVASLQRAGITHLVVRNDLDLTRTGGPRPATVRRLLATAPGLQRVASFGSVAGDRGVDGRVATPPGGPATEAFRDIDVYEVPPADGTGAAADPRIATYPASGTLVVGGGPEATLQLDPTDLEGRAIVLDVDRHGADLGPVVDVATDTARRRDVEFGAIRDASTYTLTPGQRSPITGDEPVDRWPADAPTGLTDARLQGAASLEGNGGVSTVLHPEDQPFAAFDGDPRTRWVAPNAGLSDWLEVTFDQPEPIRRLEVDIPDQEGVRISELEVTTDQGSRTVAVRPGTTAIRLPAGPTRRVRLRVADVAGTRQAEAPAITDVRIDGRHLRRGLVAAQPESGADLVSLDRARADRFDTVRRDEDAKLDRWFRWTGGPSARMSGTATAQPGPALRRAIAEASPAPRSGDVQASASSTLRDEPGLAPAKAIDGDPTTAWVSDAEVRAPRLDLRWQGDVVIDDLKVVPVADAGGSGLDPVGRVDVVVDGKRYERTLDSTGTVSIPATSTDRLRLEFPADEPSARRVGIAEVAVPALVGRFPEVASGDTRIALACGAGPKVRIDGRVVPTTASATIAQIERGAAVRWRACAPVRLARGTHHLTSEDGALVPSTVRIAPTAGLGKVGRPRAATVERWDAEDRRVSVAAGPRTILATSENANDGWQATLDGRRLTPIRVDGWRQGWIVPAGGAGTVVLRYAPGRAQHLGLALGLACLVGLVALALWPARRASGWEPPGERRIAFPVAAALAIGAALGLCWPVVVVAVPLLVAARRGRQASMGWIAGGATVLAGLVAVVWAGADIGSGQGTFSGAAQALAAVAIVAVAASLSEAAGSTPSTPGPGDRPPPGTGTTPGGSG